MSGQRHLVSQNLAPGQLASAFISILTDEASTLPQYHPYTGASGQARCRCGCSEEAGEDCPRATPQRRGTELSGCHAILHCHLHPLSSGCRHPVTHVRHLRTCLAFWGFLEGLSSWNPCFSLASTVLPGWLAGTETAVHASLPCWQKPELLSVDVHTSWSRHLAGSISGPTGL